VTKVKFEGRHIFPRPLTYQTNFEPVILMWVGCELRLSVLLNAVFSPD